MVKLLETSINSNFDTVEIKFRNADSASMEIRISAILAKPIYILNGTQWYSDDAYHLRNLNAFVCDDGSPVLGSSPSGIEKNFHIILQDDIDVPSISFLATLLDAGLSI
ncbi:unnamed protein product [Clonostachys byssicola]|uniref:Uncharacterized protein n=1 Tax=Clonostachys byssicola TaxID=160290 RepID=A0A9N9UEY7_9HYPO|nr:unnamed protein product [Clonostachys byssicola]